MCGFFFLYFFADFRLLANLSLRSLSFYLSIVGVSFFVFQFQCGSVSMFARSCVFLSVYVDGYPIRFNFSSALGTLPAFFLSFSFAFSVPLAPCTFFCFQCHFIFLLLFLTWFSHRYVYFFFTRFCYFMDIFIFFFVLFLVLPLLLFRSTLFFYSGNLMR